MFFVTLFWLNLFISLHLDTASNLEGGLPEISVEVLHLILTHLIGNNNSGVKPELKENLTNRLKKGKTKYPIIQNTL